MSANFSTSDSSSFDESALIGKTLNNKYLIIYKIGSGAYSTVWLCMDIKTKVYYAIKVLYPDGFNVGLAEAELLKKIKKSKCQYFNHSVDDFKHTMNDEDYCCIVFELLAGSLYDIMKYGKYKNGFPLDIVKIIVKQVLLAMDELTGKFNMIHTDIKPENVLVNGLSHKMTDIIALCNSNKKKLNKNTVIELQGKFNDIRNKYKDLDSDSDSDSNNNLELLSDIYINKNMTVKLSDFGNCISSNKKNYRIQTRYYRAPEIILESEFSDKCDIWSVGCLVYELLTGKTLFDPNKKRRFSTDRAHLYEMMSLLGEIPEELIKKSNRKIELFKKNGLLKGSTYNEIKYIPLKNKLEPILKDSDLNSTVDFIQSLLQYLPSDRPSIQAILNDSWIKIKN